MRGSGPSEVPLKVMTPRRASGHESNSQIPFIRSSLNLQIAYLSDLCHAMDSFQGLTDSEKGELRQNMFDTYEPLNTHLSADDLKTFIETQLYYQTESSRVFVNKFSTPFMSLAIPVILLSAALAEALINSLVATGLILSGRSDLFAIFDRMEIREKWRLGPKLISGTIQVDFGNHRFGQLKELLELRNALMHSKVDITSSDETAKIKGTSRLKILINHPGRRSLIEFGTLPDAIFDLVIESIEDHPTKASLRTSSFRFSL